ncbi:uncharacterized protein Dwil_GK16846 [Drosophila willistoni]|uniref:Odorant receptor n=1 Tax=Drosophila willistoni TaxID=7260 RepID=B4MM50_DROWI|nr:odorant receptor 65a [Drosophila willistoni]EDW73059.2 uncharacterized protein Dwil_GK16846 [Drosophila willistoni]
MAVPSSDGIIVRLWEQYNVGWRLYKNLEQIPRHMTPYYSREQMKIMGNYANAEERLLTRRRVWQVFLLVKLTMFIVPTVIGLTESLDSIVEFSEDALWTISALYVFARWAFYYLKADQVDEIVDALEECHHEWNVGPNSEETQSLRRWYYHIETGLSVCWHIGLMFLMALLILAPVWTSQQLPFHAVYPFNLHNPEEHPISYILIYISQSCCVIYFLPWLLLTEFLSCHCFFQLAANLKILCIQLRNLNQFTGHGDNEQIVAMELKKLIEFHQKIMHIVDRVNDVFYNPLLTFLLANFILLLLCTFAALAARHQPLVAGRFIMTMPIVFGALIYWSKCGDLVTQTSQDVAAAAFEAYDCPLWVTRSSIIQRDLMFLIQRAQKPLTIGARAPLPAFNLVTCMAVSSATPKGRHQHQQQQQQQQHKHKQRQTKTESETETQTHSEVRFS